MAVHVSMLLKNNSIIEYMFTNYIKWDLSKYMVISLASEAYSSSFSIIINIPLKTILKYRKCTAHILLKNVYKFINYFLNKYLFIVIEDFKYFIHYESNSVIMNYSFWRNLMLSLKTRKQVSRNRSLHQRKNIQRCCIKIK